LTANIKLSIPNTLWTDRPKDYDKNTATIEWPDGAAGQPLAITHEILFAAGRVPLAKEFVRRRRLAPDGPLGRRNHRL
jgi:hypothetical protein